MYNKNNELVIGNLPMHPHLYLMKDGTFTFEDEHNCLSSESYSTFPEVKAAFVKYSADLMGIGSSNGMTPVEHGRRLHLADALRGLRTTICHLLYSKENADVHKKLDALEAAGKIVDGLDAYVQILDPLDMPF